MNKFRLHTFNIIKLLFMLTFVSAMGVLKLEIDIIRGVRLDMHTYDFKYMIESLIYSVLILFGGALALNRLI